MHFHLHLGVSVYIDESVLDTCTCYYSIHLFIEYLYGSNFQQTPDSTSYDLAIQAHTSNQAYEKVLAIFLDMGKKTVEPTQYICDMVYRAVAASNDFDNAVEKIQRANKSV